MLLSKMLFLFSLIEKNSHLIGAWILKWIWMCLTRHRVSKCAQHNGLDKLSIQNLKIRVTRYPCGSRDKAESRPNTKLPVSINSYTGRGLIGSSPLNLATAMKTQSSTWPGRELEDYSSHSNQLGKQAESRHQNPIKKTRARRLVSAIISCQL